MFSPLPIPHTNLTLSTFALGAGAFNPDLDPAAIDRLYETFRNAHGITFDSAHCYSFWTPAGAGCNERALGAAIRRHHDRPNVRIITKGGHPADLPRYPRPDFYLAPETLAADIADSLRNLNTEYLDLFLLHRDDTRIPVGEIIDALHTHLTAGTVRAIGASNWSTARLAEANAYALAHHRAPFVLSSPQFSLAQPNAPRPTSDPAMRYLDDEDLAFHTRTGLPALCYAPTANGYFASEGRRAREAYDNPTSQARLARATKLAQHLHATPHQIALAYLLAQPFLAIPILGTSNPAHLTEALQTPNYPLTPTQLKWLHSGQPA